MSGRESLFDDPERVVAIIGSRNYPGDVDYALNAALAGAGGLVSGGAPNVDRRAEAMARDRDLTVVSYRPKDTGSLFVIERWLNGERESVVDGWTFNAFPRAAKQRNWWIIRDGKMGVHALWDGFSPGTAHGIAAAARLSRPLRIWMDGDS